MNITTAPKVAQIVATLDETSDPMQLDHLPDEVLTTILSFLDATSLTRVARINTKFLRVSSENLLWRDLALRTFRFWDDSERVRAWKLEPATQNWRRTYKLRHTANSATKARIRSMVGTSTGRLLKAREIQRFGYGVKDVLLTMYDDAPSESVLAQRYWVHAMLGCINRSYALNQLNIVKFRETLENPTEMALAALDMFILGPDAAGDVSDTFHRLNRMVAAVRLAHPNLEGQTTREKACIIAEFLREKKWIGIENTQEYYSIENQFLGIALRSSHHNSLPLVSCVIYCYVCRAFNMRAQPCSYPNHVHAVIQPPPPLDSSDSGLDLDNKPLPADFRRRNTLRDSYSDLTSSSVEPPSELTHLYIDPFNTSEPVSLQDLNQQLTFTAANVSRVRRATCLLPADPRSLLIRTARNIINCVREAAIREHTRRAHDPTRAADPDLFDEDGHKLSIDLHAATYAALYVQVLFATHANGISENIEDLRAYFVHHFPEDIPNYLTYIRPYTQNWESQPVEDELVRALMAQDQTAPQPKLRRDVELLQTGAGVSEPIVYTVGTVFRHRRQGYTAVIYGWDGSCNMEERWIVGNGVDRLPNGRGQPFYNAYVDDKSSRYVAQENIIPLTPAEFTAEDAEKTFNVQIGHWFLRFDPETARFVSNIREEYPDD